MNCKCFDETEDVIKKDRGCISASAVNKALLINLKSGKSRMAIMVPFRMSFEGRKKAKIINIQAEHCPFCGVKFEDESEGREP